MGSPRQTARGAAARTSAAGRVENLQVARQLAWSVVEAKVALALLADTPQATADAMRESFRLAPEYAKPRFVELIAEKIRAERLRADDLTGPLFREMTGYVYGVALNAQDPGAFGARLRDLTVLGGTLTDQPLVREGQQMEDGALAQAFEAAGRLTAGRHPNRALWRSALFEASTRAGLGEHIALARQTHQTKKAHRPAPPGLGPETLSQGVG